jgi:hypothetical protein
MEEAQGSVRVLRSVVARPLPASRNSHADKSQVTVQVTVNTQAKSPENYMMTTTMI